MGIVSALDLEELLFELGLRLHEGVVLLFLGEVVFGLNAPFEILLQLSELLRKLVDILIFFVFHVVQRLNVGVDVGLFVEVIDVLLGESLADAEFLAALLQLEGRCRALLNACRTQLIRNLVVELNGTFLKAGAENVGKLVVLVEEFI